MVESEYVHMLDADLQVPGITPQAEEPLLREYRRRSIRLAIAEVAYVSTRSDLEPEGLVDKHLPRDWAVMLRDIVGPLPFRPVGVELTWLTPGVVALAEPMYRDRDFDGMPVLGDALEDAGCDNTDILTHCRSDAAHVRGCWVVDAILGKL
jgi:hypothetical protein